MQRNKQVVVNVLTVMALLLATIGLAPAAASIAGTQSAPAAQSASVQAAPTGEGPGEGFMGNIVPKNGINDGGGDENVAEGNPADRDDSFYSRRTAHDPNVNFTIDDAAALRAEAAAQLSGQLQNQPARPTSPLAYGGPWASVGPNPMVLTSRGDATFDAMAGRIGALAIRSSAPYTMYLGGAQGGVWTMASPYTGTWTPRTDFLGSLAIGAIALAPSNENIVYVGTGEGALSGDSYFGNGVLKSIDGGTTYSHISAAGYFTKVSISKIVVDAADPNTLYAGTLRGRGGNRRTSPPDASPFGVYKSIDGGINWTIVLTASTNVLALSGVTDLAIDPQNSQVIYASILGSGISKTVDGGSTWVTAMNGLPVTPNYGVAPTRMALGISRPTAAVSATLYTGFEYYNASNVYQPSVVFKSTNDGNTWAQTTDTGNVVSGYCGTSPGSTQCFYDNVIGVDPGNANIVYALGLYNYGTGSGGIFRSTDGGTNWVDIGFNLHPDYHAIAIRKDNPAIVVMGNDGGVWWSSSRGGRLTAGDPITATTWNNLNGLVNPATSATLFRSGLALGQFTSIATNPAVANRFYGGLQDNGTQRKTTGNSTWADVASGDGGQVLLDPTDANYFYGTYYGISPYRFVDGGGLYLGGATSNQYIRNGINLADRSEFYIPWMMDPGNSNRLYLGTYRVYRTDNAKTANAADVFWNAISGDLTSGCTGAASNGGRGCDITAFGKSAGSPALYVGTEEGWIWTTADSTVASPTWVRRDISGTTPLRPVAAFAVDRSNYRTAYVAFSGFDPATPATPGHVFKTIDGGQTWANITNNLPDIPLNSIDVDPSEPNTLYVGSDIGPYVSTDNGATWNPLGSGFPIVTVHQMAINAFTRQLVAATHGRGIWALTDSATQLPALQISKSAPDAPIGPGTPLQYAVTIQNYGNITATNVVITDPIPANTSFMAAGSGGALVGSNVVWTVPQVAMPVQVATGGSLGVGLVPGSATVTFTVLITNSVTITTGDVITNDGYLAKSAEGPGAVGSPYYVTLAPGYAVSATPATQIDGTRAGQSVTYRVSINNDGFNTDNYDLAVSGNTYPTTIWNADLTTQITQTGSIIAGRSVDVVLKVAVPSGATNGQTDAATLTATSVGSPSVSASALVTTTAVTYDILVVDNDNNAPNVSTYYTTALTTAGYSYNYWNLATAPANVLPPGYLKAHKIVVWFAGASYPAPLGPYEGELADFLDGGGKLFMSGQDILDQAAGTTAFVHDFLHIDWDGTEAQNDKGTVSATAPVNSPFSGGMGTISVTNAAVGLTDFNDQITPIYPAEPAFLDDKGQPDALQVDAGTYKVIFLAFPFEAYGNAANRATLIDRGVKYLTANNAVTGDTVTGPASGSPNTSYAFTGSITPITSTRPVRYYWEATDQSPVMSENLSSDSINFNWTTAGTKTITLTASNEEAAVQLSGINETPPVNSAASGIATFTYNRATRELAYELTAMDMSPTMAHIHRGAVGVAGPIAYPFSTTPFTTTLTGVFTLTPADEALLFSDGLYVNVHTVAHPAGEIRGQIHMTGGYATTTATINLQYRLLLPIIRK